MSTVKTAISIDAHFFHRVEKLTRKLHISRSQFFTQAARHMIDRDENVELLQRINAAYKGAGTAGEEKVHTKTRIYAGRKATDKW
jgi:metal-responsive CopG/Arc/MetJ family transcriptional regulator